MMPTKGDILTNQHVKSDKDLIKPSHYHNGSIDVIGFCEQYFSSEEFQAQMVFNVIKYVARYKDKNGRDDLVKARNYMNILFDHIDKIN